jgi:thiol-disulfide isomerase/thioredoxin
MSAEEPFLPTAAASWCLPWLIGTLLLPTLPAPAQQIELERLDTDLVELLDADDTRLPGNAIRFVDGRHTDRSPRIGSSPDNPHGKQTLRWWNGQSMQGRIVAIKPNELSWNHDCFAEPARIRNSTIYEITSPSTPQELPDDLFVFILTNGDRIFGALEKLDHQHLVIRSPTLGIVHLRQQTLRRVERITGAGILYAGPRDITNWQHVQFAQQGRNRAAATWIEASKGSLRGISTQGGIRLPLPPSDTPLEISLTLSCDADLPRFNVHLETDKAGDSNVRLCIWGNLLVLCHGDRFSLIEELTAGRRSVDLRILHNPHAGGRGSILDADGSELANWNGAEPSQTGATETDPRPLASIMIKNNGAHLNLDHLRVREITASDAAPIKNTAHSADKHPSATVNHRPGLASAWHVEVDGIGTLLCPTAPTITGNQITFTSASGTLQRHSRDSLLSLRRDQPVDSTTVNPEGQPAIRARLQDDSIIQGHFAPEPGAADPGTVCVISPHALSPLSFGADSLRRLTWLDEPENLDEPDPSDAIEIGNATLHGKWATVNGHGIMWLPHGGLQPIALALDDAAEFSLVRAGGMHDSREPRTSALIYLVDGQVLPARIAAIKENGLVELQPGTCERRSLPQQLVSAILFPHKQTLTTGFTDPGWRFTTDTPDADAFRDTDGGRVLIDPRHSWGHPSLLIGSELCFNITRISGHGGVKIGLFGNGNDHKNPATYLLIANWGNRVYHGISGPEGEFTGRYTQTMIPDDQHARVRITWDSDRITYSINDIQGDTVPLDETKAPRSGFGLLFESCTIWGNDPGQCHLSGFSLTPSHDEGWIPAVRRETRDRALFLPRFRRQDPPQHVLLAANGDLLSGAIRSINDSHLVFRSRLETISIPRERITAAVWVKPAEAASSPLDNAPTTGATDYPQPPDTAAGSHPSSSPQKEKSWWIALFGGGLLTMELEGFEDGFAIGHSTQLGACRIPVASIHAVYRSNPGPSAASSLLSEWRLRPAPEPRPEGSIAGLISNSDLIGKTAPEIRLPLLDGEEFILSRERGKVVILDFWASWCAPCIEAMPELLDAFKDFQQHELVLAAINQAESPATVRRFLEEQGWKDTSGLVVALDPDQETSTRYAFKEIPFTVVIDTDGKTAAIIEGYRPGNARILADMARKIISEAIRIN